MPGQTDGYQRGQHDKGAGDPQAGFQAVLLEDPAGQQRPDQPAKRVGHVVETDIQRHAVFLGVADDQVAVQRRVDGKDGTEDQ